MLIKFDITLGKGNLYPSDREENFFSAAPTMYTGQGDDLDNRTTLIWALDSHFKKWDISCHERYNYVNNLFRFNGENGIVRFDNEETSEFFALSYNAVTEKVNLYGMLSPENCKNLQKAFVEYGHHLEDNKWMKHINLFPEKQYGYLKPLVDAFEKEGLVVSYRQKNPDSIMQSRDDLYISTKGKPNLSFSVHLETLYKKGDEWEKKSLETVSNEIKEMMQIFSPVKDVPIYIYRLGHGYGGELISYNDPVMKRAVDEGYKFKLASLRAVGKTITTDLTPDAKVSVKRNKQL